MPRSQKNVPGQRPEGVPSSKPNESGWFLYDVGNVVPCVSPSVPLISQQQQRALAQQMPAQCIQSFPLPEPLQMQNAVLAQAPPQPAVERVRVDFFSNATHATQGITFMVEQAAIEIDAILQDPEQKGLKTALFKLADALQSAIGPDTSLELDMAKDAINACTPLVRAYIMGACHYRARDHHLKSPWRVFLLGGPGNRFKLSLKHVAESREDDLEDKTKRAETIKAAMVHLSWLAPPWHMSALQEKLAHDDPLDEGIAILFKILTRLHAELHTQPEIDALLNEVLSAIVPAYCSPLIADRLLDPKHAADWIDNRLLQAARAVQAATGPQLYPVVGPIPSAAAPPKTRSNAGVPDANAGSKRAREQDVGRATHPNTEGAGHGAKRARSQTQKEMQMQMEAKMQIQMRSRARGEPAPRPTAITTIPSSSRHEITARKTLPYVVTSFRIPLHPPRQSPTTSPVVDPVVPSVIAPEVVSELEPPPLPFAFFARRPAWAPGAEEHAPQPHMTVPTEPDDNRHRRSSNERFSTLLAPRAHKGT